MAFTRNHIVTVATVDDGEVQSYPFVGDPMLLSEVLEKLNVDVTDYNQVQINNAVVGEDELETVKVQDKDQVFLVPLIQGGA